MHGVGTGSTLDGRYVLHRRVQTRPTFERWTATDQTLERPVVLLCLPADVPHAAAVLDAARRAAGIDDPRLVRVHAVGQDRTVAFVVEEDPAPAEPLLTIFRGRALPGHEVRRLVGETASALEIARARGLHHLALTPSDVLRRPDGSIAIRGLETKAALLGLDASDSDQASRTDAVALVALAYAGLTTRWPLPEVAGAPSGLEHAPSFVGGIPAPSEIAAGVPADLDVIARQTFGAHLGPLTPGDLARQIAPWSELPLELSALSAPPAAGQIGYRADSPEAADGAGLDADGTAGDAEGGGTGHLTVAGGAPGAPPSGVAAALGVPAGVAPSSVAPSSVVPSVVAASFAATSELVSRTGTQLRGLAKSGAGRLTAARERARVTREVGAGPTEATGPAYPLDPLHAPELTAHEQGHEVGTPATPPQFSAQAGPAPAASREGRAGVATQGQAALGPAPVQPTGPAPLLDDRPLSILPESTALPPTREQSRLAIAIVLGFLVIVTALAVFNLPGMGVSRSPAPTAAVPRATPTTPAPAASTAPATVTPIRIRAALGFDPQGDGTEGSDSAARALDGSATTSWRSEWYRSTGYGGLKKGVGLALDLGTATPIHQVVVTLPARQDFTVYAAPRLSLTDAVKIGSGTKATGSTTITVTGTPPSTRYVIVWVTLPAADGEGHFRAQISDVALR